MSSFLNAKYQALEAYTPGEQPRDKQYIKLNTNESPYPPSQAVLAALGEDDIKDLRLYSDPEGKELKAALARLYGVGADQIFLSNGSDDILISQHAARQSEYAIISLVDSIVLGQAPAVRDNFMHMDIITRYNIG